MTEATVVTIIVATVAAIPPTLAALATFRQGKANAVKTDALTVKAEEIHTLTNSNLAAVKAELAQAIQQIEELRALIASLTEPGR